MARHPWKKELLKLAEDLKKKKGRTKWSSVVLKNLEQNIYWAFLMIRKLLESNPAHELCVPVISYMPYEEDGHLQLHRPREQSWALTFLCNEIVHSAFFAWNFWDDGKLRGFIFCSGRRSRFRYLITAEIFIAILERVGMSEVEENLWTPIKFSTRREGRGAR